VIPITFPSVPANHFARIWDLEVWMQKTNGDGLGPVGLDDALFSGQWLE
jgi:hypothetical protein